MNTLQDLTGQESGIVVYEHKGEAPQAIICNWSSVNGLPRMFVTGLLGLGEIDLEGIGEIPFNQIDSRKIVDIGAALEGTIVIYDNNGDAEGLIGTPGSMWEFPDPGSHETSVRVYAPESWA